MMIIEAVTILEPKKEGLMPECMICECDASYPIQDYLGNCKGYFCLAHGKEFEIALWGGVSVELQLKIAKGMKAEEQLVRQFSDPKGHKHSLPNICTQRLSPPELLTKKYI